MRVVVVIIKIISNVIDVIMSLMLLLAARRAFWPIELRYDFLLLFCELSFFYWWLGLGI